MPSQLDTAQTETTRSTARSFKYLDALTTAFVVILLVSNLIAQKVCLLGPLSIFGRSIGPFAVSGAVLLFPVTYIFGDVFTEVYGYQASRRAIWIGFFASALLSAAGAMAVALPADPGWHNQQAFEKVFGVVPRFVAASLIAYWTGEFANSFTLAKLKVLTRGRWLWTRTIGSTVVGQAFDTFLVMFISFAGTVSRPTLIRLMVSSYLIKVGYETLATPLTYAGVAWLKRREGVDALDTRTDFNPFSLRNLSPANEVKTP